MSYDREEQRASFVAKVSAEADQLICAALGTTLDSLPCDGVALVGSRSVEGAARPDSDWDIVVLARGPWRVKLRVGGARIELMYEEPVRDVNWSIRDQAFHLTGYGIWLRGGPTWSPTDLDWESAVAKKENRLKNYMQAAARIGLVSGHHLARKVDDARRMQVLLDGQYIPPTALLPKKLSERVLALFPSFVREVVETACTPSRERS